MISIFRTSCAIGFATFIAACVAGEAPMEQSRNKTADGGFVRISEKSDFVDLVDGKKFRRDQTWWALSADGRMFGFLKSGKIVGTWEWDDGAWCREFRAGQKVKALECQHIFAKGNTVMFVKERGEGAKSTQTLSR